MCFNNKIIVITTNKVAASLNLNIVEKYIKKLNDVDSSDIISLRLPQLKSYLKILSISYFANDISLSITLDIIEQVIKTIHLFKNTILASCLHVIKASLKSDMAVV